jgi:hypothetical protein
LQKERDPPALPAKKVTVSADAGQKPSGAKASMLMHLKAKAGKMTTKRRLYDADAQLLMVSVRPLLLLCVTVASWFTVRLMIHVRHWDV